jgi:hypothetical protein
MQSLSNSIMQIKRNQAKSFRIAIFLHNDSLILRSLTPLSYPFEHLTLASDRKERNDHAQIWITVFMASDEHMP